MLKNPTLKRLNPESLLILAKQSNNFAISDLGSMFFGGYEDEDEGGRRKGLYLHRPPGLPPDSQSQFQRNRPGGRSRTALTSPSAANTVSVTVEDPNSANIFSKELPISPRGTFNGEIEIAEEAPLGTYRIAAEVDGGSASGNFEVAEYKKPEYKVLFPRPANLCRPGRKQISRSTPVISSARRSLMPKLSTTSIVRVTTPGPVRR